MKEIKDYFKKLSVAIIVTSVIAFVIGLVMVVMPDLSLQAIGITIGIFAIAFGIALIVMDFMINRIHIQFYGIITGILSIVIGIIFIAMPNVLPTVFAIALGLWVILSSVNIISIAITVRNGVSNWFLLLLFGIIDLIAGVVILLNPFASSISVVVLGGIILMIHSVVTIVDTVMIRSNAKEVAKAVEDSYKEIKASSASK